jgi:hypothetical protein
MYFTGLLLQLDCADATRGIVARFRLVYSRSQQSFNGLALQVEAATLREITDDAVWRRHPLRGARQTLENAKRDNIITIIQMLARLIVGQRPNLS